MLWLQNCLNCDMQVWIQDLNITEDVLLDTGVDGNNNTRDAIAWMM